MPLFRSCLFAILFPLLGFKSFAGSVEDLGEVRQLRLVKPFLGTYLTGSALGNVNEEINVVINGGALQLWYPCSNIPCSHFSMPLNGIGKTFQEQRRTSKGMALVESEYSITEGPEGYTAVMKETHTARTWKSIETHSLRLKHSYLYEEHTRHYFKKTYGLFGEWIEDLTSFNGKRNTLNIKGSLLKISSQPLPLDVYIQQVQSLPSTYIVLTKPLIADNLKEVIESGDFEVVVDVPRSPENQAPRKSADIFEISKYSKGPVSCQDALQDTTEPE